MLTLDNLEPVRQAFKADLAAMENGTYVAPLPAAWMMTIAGSEEVIQKQVEGRRKTWEEKRRRSAGK